MIMARRKRKEQERQRELEHADRLRLRAREPGKQLSAGMFLTSLIGWSEYGYRR